ncbi:MAG TPA: hypothetical protein VMF61_01105 [Candidatus Acidoferrales bacterium]|nr:hypothetical protein [Candidatus Acidoferrales bacterium]
MTRHDIARTLQDLERCHAVVIDLTQAETVDSNLLSELVAFKRRCVVRERPPSIQVRCHRRLARLMQVAGLDALFDMRCP